VLVVVVLLSLAVYHYSDLTLAEYKAADQAHRQAQAVALADSGVHYTAALLSNSSAMSSQLNGNPYQNITAFANVRVKGKDASGYPGTFTLLAPPDPQGGSGSVRNGVIDESGKINLNSMMVIDPSGKALQTLLQQLPNMTPDIAASIVDWIDADNTPLTGGAE